MSTNTLPTDKLKEFGIINDDNTFSKKLNADDIQKFLHGYTIVADNDDRRATFQLVDNNSQLKVIFLQRDLSLAQILKKSKESIIYSSIINASLSHEFLNFEKKAYVFDKENNKIVEFDVIKNTMELTAIIVDSKNPKEIDNYKAELLKLKSFLQEKISEFPEIAKEINNNLNIVSNVLTTINSIIQKNSNGEPQKQSNIQLNVNDPDLYQDANRLRNEEFEQNENDALRLKSSRR